MNALGKSIVVLLVTSAALADEADMKPIVAPIVQLKNISSTKFSSVRHDPRMPVVVTSLEDTKKMKEKLKGIRVGAMNKQVDYDKQKVVIFRWSGSGGDRISAKLQDGDPKKVVVMLERGSTNDLRYHCYAFAIDKSLEWEIE